MKGVYEELFDAPFGASDMTNIVGDVVNARGGSVAGIHSPLI